MLESISMAFFNWSETFPTSVFNVGVEWMVDSVFGGLFSKQLFSLFVDLVGFPNAAGIVILFCDVFLKGKNILASNFRLKCQYQCWNGTVDNCQ